MYNTEIIYIIFYYIFINYIYIILYLEKNNTYSKNYPKIVGIHGSFSKKSFSWLISIKIIFLIWWVERIFDKMNI